MSQKEYSMIDCSKCKRCKDWFFPNTANSVLCPMCVGKQYPAKQRKCKVFDCQKVIGKHGALGFCEKHYSSLVAWPREKAMLASQREGSKMCETFAVCERFFIPKSKFHSASQKFCDSCRKARNR